MVNMLHKICEEKRRHIADRKLAEPLFTLENSAKAASDPRGFSTSLRRALASKTYGLIAEIKKASPSKGLIRPNFEPSFLALAYAAGGASCLSVLTDTPYFQGADEHLVVAREAVALPVIRKDFMLDPYQIIESRALGADCILLIMAALEDRQAAELAETAREWQMDVLVEVHDRDELERALRLPTDLIGINNRDLKSLVVDLAMTEKLAEFVPKDRILISESGFYTADDLSRMTAVGAHCFLIGESLMRQDDVEAATRSLLSNGVDGK